MYLYEMEQTEIWDLAKIIKGPLVKYAKKE